VVDVGQDAQRLGVVERRRGVEAARRVVPRDDRRARGHHLGDGDALALAAGDAADELEGQTRIESVGRTALPTLVLIVWSMPSILSSRRSVLSRNSLTVSPGRRLAGVLVSRAKRMVWPTLRLGQWSSLSGESGD